MTKTPLEITYQVAQDCVSRAPVIILGSGASAAYQIPGMPALKDHLLAIGAPKDALKEDLSHWQRFTERLLSTDLESALTEIRLPDSMTRHVVTSTWDFLTPNNAKVFEELLQNRNLFPLTQLYQHLFKSTHQEINVVTPNYDLLAEYAADAGGITHFTGFGFGYLRSRARNGSPQKIYSAGKPTRTVNIWKVHGSFDWFKDKEGVVTAIPVPSKRPPNLEPVIVTPGIEKYRLTHDEPFLSIKQGADLALQSARSFLCIGYGFNDPHMQTKLVERSREDIVPLVLITRTISDAAKLFLKSGQCKRYLAIEKSGPGCKIYTNEHPDGSEVPVEDLWRLDKFLTMVVS